MNATSYSLPASPLMSILPMGCGTAMVESLDSYRQRLAAAHRVPPYFVDALVVGGEVRIERQKRTKTRICLDAPSRAAMEYAARLAQLTNQPTVEKLGLGILSSTVNRLGLRTSSVQWCPGCFWDMSKRGEPAYRPQLWSCLQYSICHIHKDFMRTRCPHCSRVWKSDAPCRGPMDVCNECNQSLFYLYGNRLLHLTVRVPRLEGTAKFRSSLALVDLITLLPQISSKGYSLKFDWDRLFSYCRKFDMVDSQADMARAIGVSPSVLTGFSNEKYLPSLDSLVWIAIFFGIYLPGLICPKLWKVSTSPTAYKFTADACDLSRSKPRTYYDWSRIEKLVTAEIAKGCVDLPAVVAKRIELAPEKRTP
jgi:transcriptional regulator with XRE-family HTH domain